MSTATTGVQAGAGAADTAPAVEVRDVHKSYGETRALSGCTLTARAGEIHAIVGENGSGKSTLVKILSGVLAPDRGTVAIGGSAPPAVTPRAFQGAGLATIFQEVLMVDSGSVTDNVFLGDDGLFRARRGPEEKRARTTELLRRLTGAPVDPDAPVETLSLAARQWVAIARALAREPRVLILDESTAALDLKDAGALSRELERLRDAGVCILLVTHRIKELQHLADRATVLRAGVSVATIDRAEISERRLLELMKGERVEEIAREAASLLAVHGGRRDALVRVRDVRLTPDAEPFSLELRSGEVVGLAGLDGHGQAEFAELLAGALRPAGGRVEVAGAGGAGAGTYGSPSAAARHGIAYLPTDRKRQGIFPHLSVAENFALPTLRRDSRLGFISAASLARRLETQTERLKIKYGRPGNRITTLSGGNQQKVLIARWLAAEPRLLVLNDPTRGVDMQTKHDLYRLLREVIADGLGVVFLTTEIDELQHVCDRVVVFRNRTVGAELSHAEATPERVLAALFGVSEEEVERPLDEQGLASAGGVGR